MVSGMIECEEIYVTVCVRTEKECSIIKERVLNECTPEGRSIVARCDTARISLEEQKLKELYNYCSFISGFFNDDANTTSFFELLVDTDMYLVGASACAFIDGRSSNELEKLEVLIDQRHAAKINYFLSEAL